MEHTGSSLDLPQAASSEQERLIKIDVEHLTIRLLVPILSIVLVVLVHLLGMKLFKNVMQVQGLSFFGLMLVTDVTTLLGGTYLIERTLKHLIPSQRSALLTAEALIVTDQRHTPPMITHIIWTAPIKIKAWHFPIKRRTRVPKGWHCMALHLSQDENDVVVYTFTPPAEANTVVGHHLFIRLRPRQETQSNTNLSAAAEQRRLLKSEDLRWHDGAEIERADFNALLSMLQRHVPGWS